MSGNGTPGFAARMAANNRKNRRKNYSKGDLILQVAEYLKPGLQEKLENARDENGMRVQPARVRAIALTLAQALVNAKLAAG